MITHTRTHICSAVGNHRVDRVDRAPLLSIVSRFDPDAAELAAEREAIRWVESCTDAEFAAAMAEFDAEPWE